MYSDILLFISKRVILSGFVQDQIQDFIVLVDLIVHLKVGGVLSSFFFNHLQEILKGSL